MGNFYTRKGDDGKSYIGKKAVRKTSFELEALGQLDELNSLIGLLKSEKISKELKKILHNIQEDLFIIQSNIAGLTLGGKFKFPDFDKTKIRNIEKVIDEIEKSLKPVKKFVISGDGKISAWLDFLRSKSRSVERSVLRISRKGVPSREIKSYLNRLSSLFFALARKSNFGKTEKNPAYK